MARASSTVLTMREILLTQLATTSLSRRQSSGTQPQEPVHAWARMQTGLLAHFGFTRPAWTSERRYWMLPGHPMALAKVSPEYSSRKSSHRIYAYGAGNWPARSNVCSTSSAHVQYVLTYSHTDTQPLCTDDHRTSHPGEQYPAAPALLT